jgi:CobQ-like glutamine amidotransferase family enzyme
VVHPDLLGTYGDGGNGVILARRLSWRGFEVELVEAPSDRPVPAGADFYCLGGGEDGPEARAAVELGVGSPLSVALDAGAAVLAVCAGFQIVGRSFAAADGSIRPGLGLLDVTTEKGSGRRAVGELVAEPVAPELAGLPTLTGYENHGAVTRLGPDARALARVVVGVGNGGGDGTEGAVGGRVFATYLHGPVLARNPGLADAVLSSVLGPLEPLEDTEAEDLRRERLASAARVKWWRRHRR